MICFLVLLNTITVVYLHYRITKESMQIGLSKSRNAQRKRTELARRKRVYLFEFILAAAGTILLLVEWVIPPYLDACYHSIVTSKAVYSRTSVDYTSRFPDIGGTIYLNINGNTMSVELYPNYAENDFPEGTYSATVWYGEKSRVLLAVDIMEN